MTSEPDFNPMKLTLGALMGQEGMLAQHEYDMAVAMTMLQIFGRPQMSQRFVAYAAQWDVAMKAGDKLSEIITILRKADMPNRARLVELFEAFGIDEDYYGDLVFDEVEQIRAALTEPGVSYENRCKAALDVLGEPDPEMEPDHMADALVPGTDVVPPSGDAWLTED